MPGNKQTSLGPVRVWNLKSNWVISTSPAHPALVSDTDFLAAQAVRATCAPHDDGQRRYRLTGLLICGTCGRRLHPHWVHGRPAYRCRHGHTSAYPDDGRPRWIYWPEHRILTEALDQLARAGHLPAHAGLDDLLAHLHGSDAVIICDTATVAIDEPTVDEPAPQLHAPNPPEGQDAPTIPKQQRRNPAQQPRGTSRTISEQRRETPFRPS